MITRRYREPRGINADTGEYGFFVRVSGEDRELLKLARDKATEKLGGIPSNPMLLIEMMRIYLGSQTPSPSNPEYPLDI